MSRAILERCNVILDALLREQRNDNAATAPVNCGRLAAKLEVSKKTVQRDVEFLRDRMGFPVEYDASLHSFFLTKPCARVGAELFQIRIRPELKEAA